MMVAPVWKILIVALILSASRLEIQPTDASNVLQMVVIVPRKMVYVALVDLRVKFHN